MKRAMLLIPILTLALLLAACGGSSVLTDEPAETLAQPEAVGDAPDVVDLTEPEPADTLEPEAPADTADAEVTDEPPVSVHEGREYSFALDVLDDTYMFGGSAEDYEIVYYPYEGDYPWVTGDLFDLAVEPDLLAVEIWAKGAENLKAFCCDVTFENELLRMEYAMMPTAADPAATEFFLSAPMPTYTADNCFRHLQFMLNPDDKDGLSGDALLVTLMFENGGSYCYRELQLQPPQREESQATIEFDDAAGSLTWYYYNYGDYDQNGLVEWLDIGRMAEYFEEQPGDINSIQGLIAYGDEPISITRITSIGQNFGCAVESYNIYTGTAGSYPDDGELLGSVDFSDAQGDAASERLYFIYEVGEPQEGASYWVKPVYDGAEGVASYIAPE